ncbi:MAG: TylF/MycF/NovP-related O-methyltransferase [Microcoleaceae cyanobacterium]
MSQWQLQTPVVLIVFNRPQTTQQVFDRIRQARPLQLFVIADGPRSNRPGEVDQCWTTRNIIHQVDWDCEVFTDFSDKNLGCRQRISSGLTWVFNQVETAIILEDDCIPHPTFFQFCEELLEYYREDERVMAISGDNFQFGRKYGDESYYFSRYPHCWGWATWRRAWKYYDDTLKLWPWVQSGNNQLRQNLEQILPEKAALEYWLKIFQAVYNGFNSWAYAWKFDCWIRQGLCVLPQVNLVSNIGFGQDATHTQGSSPVENLPVEPMSFPLKHPDEVVRNLAADQFTEETLFSRQPSSSSVGSSSNSPTISSTSMTQTNPNEIITQALTSLNQNHLNQALQLFDQAIQLHPNQPELNYGKAVALARLGQTQTAVDTLKKLLTVRPQLTRARFLLTEIQPSSVLDLLQQAEALLNSDPLTEQSVNSALEKLSQAKSFRQPTAGIDYLRAVCFLHKSQPEAALQSLYEELQYFPDQARSQDIIEQIFKRYPHLNTSKVQDEEFQPILKAIRPHTMLSEARLYSLFSLVKMICQQNIPGNIVECGVARGGSTALMAWTIQRYTRQPRWLYAFDSFEGMPKPGELDKHNGVAAESTGWGTGTCSASEQQVRQVCEQLQVTHTVKTVKGYFQETLPRMRDQVGMISLLHLDGDWYESTRTILNTLYDRISDGGMIQVDDYGFWEGCRQALHEFETSNNLQFQIRPIDTTGVWFAKPESFAVNPTIDPDLVAEFNQDDPVANGVLSQMSKNERFQIYYALRQVLPHSDQPLYFIEVGSYAGSSLLLTVQGLRRVTDKFHGFAIDPAKRPQLDQVLQSVGNQVTYLQMFSHQAIGQLTTYFQKVNQPPLCIFIDGDHRYEGVKQDIVNYFPLLAPGGLMLFHDFLPPLNTKNQVSILFHHGGNEPGIRQACQELMEEEYGCEVVDLPLLYPDDPTQTQAHLPIIPGVFSTIRAYRKA